MSDLLTYKEVFMGMDTGTLYKHLEIIQKKNVKEGDIAFAIANGKIYDLGIVNNDKSVIYEGKKEPTWVQWGRLYFPISYYRQGLQNVETTNIMK